MGRRWKWVKGKEWKGELWEGKDKRVVKRVGAKRKGERRDVREQRKLHVICGFSSAADYFYQICRHAVYQAILYGIVRHGADLLSTPSYLIVPL